MRQEAHGRTTQWKENAFGKWKSLPRFGDDMYVNGFQRLSQKPLAFPLRLDVRRIEKGNASIRRSRNQRRAFTTRAIRHHGAQARAAQPQHGYFPHARQSRTASD
jgi:hypothetical protein